MISKLALALRMPLMAHNQMLSLAGFAMRYPKRMWVESEMTPVRAALERVLQQHAPYPALAVDRLWSVVRMNGPAASLFGQLGIHEGVSLLDLMTSPALPSTIENWPEVAHHAAQRLRTESAAQGGVPELECAANALALVSGYEVKPLGAVMPTKFRFELPRADSSKGKKTIRFSLFSLIAQFGTPEDVTLDDLKIELYFPENAETEQSLRAMAGQG
jgi:MmyB-like transcription regulator ligand binding domain